MPQPKKIAFLFPGQGSQYPGMGKDFVENFEVARLVFEEADDILGRKISAIILDGQETILTETKNSQVGIYTTSMAILRVIQKQFPNLQPYVCSGLSLGEYTAATAAGILSFSDALTVVERRGQFMNDACEQSPGAMAVVLGMDSESVEKMVKTLCLPNDLWVANFNCPGQVVISGTQKGIDVAINAAKEHGAKRILPLQVHGAFHSGLMHNAEEKLSEYILNIPMQKSICQFVMNVPGDFVSDLNEVRKNMISQVTNPVRWEAGIRKIDSSQMDLYIEIGCGKTLSGFNKRIIPNALTLNIENISDLDAFQKQLSS